MVVTIGFNASDRVVLFELEVHNQSLQQVPLERHLLKPREKAWLSLFLGCLFLSISHEGMILDF
jgi:hypothetical protein